MTLIRIVAPHFTAGLVYEGGRVTQAAPIVRYMRGWSYSRLLNYCCNRKGWGVEEVSNG